MKKGKKMSIKKYIEQIKKIDEKTQIIDDTVEFWANQIEDELKKCEETEANPDHPDFAKKMLNHKKNILLLLSKLNSEEENLNQAEMEIEKINEKFKKFFNS